MSDKKLSGKVALVTGAASGIGKATALRLSAEGAKVFICDINEQGLAEVEKEILAEDRQVGAKAFDIVQVAECRAVIDEAVSQFGQLDILCNIAGFAKAKHLADITEQDWHNMVAVNLSSVFFVSQSAMPHLIKSKGCIVNMASSAGLVGQAYNASYCATKAGVVMLSKSMAVEFAKQGVRVNCVCPGAVATPLVDKFEIPKGADMELMGKLFPLMEIAQPEEVAGAVAYLVSPEARFITGDALTMDGGQTAS